MEEGLNVEEEPVVDAEGKEGLPLSAWKHKSLRETSGKWGEEVRTMWWEVSADKERGQGGVTTLKHILGNLQEN